MITNDTKTRPIKLKLSADVTVPIFVSPSSRYIFFRGTEAENLSKEAEIWTTQKKPLELHEKEFTLAGKMKYDLKEVEKGRKYKLTFQPIPGSETTYRGFLTLKTNFDEQPEIKFVIRAHFTEAAGAGK